MTRPDTTVRERPITSGAPLRDGHDGREDAASRLDREHQELFDELRAVIPGAEVLFAFLLTVAFTEQFQRLSSIDKKIYLGVFMLAAIALLLLLAPSAFHRVRFRQRDKEVMIRVANYEAIAAMVLLSVSIAGGVYLVCRMTFGYAVSAAIGIGLWLVASAVWWLLPITRRVRDEKSAVRDDRA